MLAVGSCIFIVLILNFCNQSFVVSTVKCVCKSFNAISIPNILDQTSDILQKYAIATKGQLKSNETADILSDQPLAYFLHILVSQLQLFH